MFQQPFCGSFPKANSYRWRQHLLLAAFSFLLLTLSGTTLPRVSGRANATKALAQVPGPCAQQPLRLYNTGVNADGTALLAAGQTDPHYTLLNTSPLSPNALVVNQPQGNGWLANNTSSAWIGPKSTDVSPAGFYTYRTSFQINSPCSADSAVIRGAWASDNEAEILVNGQATGITTGPADFGSLQAFTLTGFNNGLNTLDFRVRNRAASTGADTATGLRVELSGNVLCCGCATPPGELADWWPFDEPSGSAAANDRSGVNNVGVYKNGPQPSPGFVGNAALCFNGTNSYVEVANHPEINFIGNCANDFAEAFTIDAWVKTTQSEGLAVILDKRDSTINGYHLYLFNGRLGFQMGGGGTFENYVAPSAGPQFVNVADGKWHFIAVTASRCLAARGRLYVDGKPVLTFTPLSAELNNSAPLNIGRRDPAHGDIYFNGCLDELEIFKRALSEDEVLSIFQAGSNGKCKVNCAQKNIALTPADLQKPVWAANTPYPSVTFTASGGTAPYTITQVGGTLPPGMSFSNGVLSGTPTTPGTYTFTVLVVDADGCKFEKRYTITIINCALALAPATLPNPSVLVGVPFGPVPFTVAGVGGGCQPLTFSISAGALPPGMTLTPAGQLVGTPTQVGTYSFTVKVIDMCGCMATREYRLEVRCPDLTLNPATLPNGAPGQSYTQVLTITGGGFGPFTWTVDSGILPPGMTLTANGQLTGTPTTSGMYTFKIKVTDAFGCMAMREYTIKIECPLVTIPGLFNTGVNDSGQRLIIGALDAHYQLTAFGGPAPAVAVGRLDNSWVTPGPNAQWISFGQAGTNATTFVYRLQFKLSNCEANSVVIKGRYAADNGAAISVNGGATQFATPTPLGHTVYTDFTLTTGFVAGVNTLEFQVRNQGSVTGLLVEFTEATARCCACSTITIAPGALPTATAGANYSATLTATGGMAPYTFSATGLPTGFTLNSNGQLTGMSMTAGSFIIKVMVIDAKGCMAMRRYRLVVTCGQININPPTLPDTTVGTAYNQTLSATGGCGSYTFSAVTLAPGAPALPPGLTLSPQGVLSGTPAVCGAFVFEVKVTDKCGCMATRRYTLKVDGVTGPIAGLFNTGVDNSNNLLASGATDAHYLVKRPTTTTYGNAVTITPVAGWVTSSTARWITPTGQPDDFGQHRYRMTFNLAGCDLSTVQITGRYAADNSAYIAVNTSTVKLAPTPLSTGFKQFTPFTITAADGLTQNVNTLEFVVQNDDGPTGLLVEISGTAKCCPCRLTLGPDPLPSGATLVNYSTTLFTSGGTPNYTYTATSPLPPGLTLSSAGVLSGRPTGCGDYRFVVLVQDSRGCFARREFRLTINCYEVSATYDVTTITQSPPPPDGQSLVAAPQQLASTLSVNVSFNAQGNEQAIRFSLGFNPALLSNPRVTPGEAVAEADLEINESQLVQGNLGLSLTMPTGQTLPAGPLQLVNVLFDFAAANNGALTNIEFKDTPVARGVTASGPAQTPQFTNVPILLAPRAVTVSAANFAGARLAANQIVSAFGVSLATGTASSNASPLPTTLLGTTVKVTDSTGTERDAPLFFVSPGQVNYLIPNGTAAGQAVVRFTSGDGSLSGGIVQIAAIAPGLFSVSANGRGLPAANVLRFKPDNSFTVERLAVFDATTSQFVPIPIDLGPEGDRIFLSLFGSGIRGRTAQANVRAFVDDVEAPVSFASAQGSLVGLDQINIELPRSLIGRGLVDLVLTVDGLTANLLQVSIQ